MLTRTENSIAFEGLSSTSRIPSIIVERDIRSSQGADNYFTLAQDLQDMKEYISVFDGINIIIKSLKLVTSDEATYLALGTVNTADIKEAQEKIKLLMETLYEVHLTNFTEMTDFLANNDAAVSADDKIKLLTDATITFPTLNE